MQTLTYLIAAHFETIKAMSGYGLNVSQPKLSRIKKDRAAEIN